jgi:hypothetical protein
MESIRRLSTEVGEVEFLCGLPAAGRLGGFARQNN